MKRREGSECRDGRGASVAEGKHEDGEQRKGAVEQHDVADGIFALPAKPANALDLEAEPTWVSRDDIAKVGNDKTTY